MLAPGEFNCQGVTPCDFAKYEAFGNDYLIIDPLRTSTRVTPRIASLIADRKRGIGADGILWGPFADGNRICLKIFNSDGTECPRSGNGIRIFAHYLRRRGYINQDAFSLSTSGNVSPVAILDVAAAIVRVGLGHFRLNSRAIRARGEQREMLEEIVQIGRERVLVSCVSNGTPHCIVFRENLPPSLGVGIGSRISGSRLFPEGINVAIVDVKNRRRIEAEFWERGAGTVPSSGSGAGAAAFVAHLLGHTGCDVEVVMQGGTLSVSTDLSGETFIAGEVRHVADGVFSATFRSMLEQNASPLMEECGHG